MACVRLLRQGRFWWGVAGLALLVTVAWQIENLRGFRRFEAAKAQLVRAGLSLDWRDYHRKPAISDAENIAKQPPFDAVRVTPKGDSFYPEIEPVFAPWFEELPGDLLNGRLGELEEWASRLDPEGKHGTPAERVLQATAPLDSRLEALQAALALQACEWMPIDLDRLNFAPVPQITDMTDTNRAWISLLFTRARAHLELGHPDKAADEILTVIRFGELMKHERGSAVGALVRNWLSHQTTKSGLDQLLLHSGWNDSALERVQETILGIDLLAHMRRASESEVAWIVGFGEATIRKEDWTRDAWSKDVLGSMDFGPGVKRGQWVRAVWKGLQNRFYTTLPSWMPRGWHGQNVARVVEWWDDYLLSIYDPQLRRVYPRPEPNYAAMYANGPTPYTFLSMWYAPQASHFFESAAEGQTRWDLLRVMCALQRYRLQHGSYPESLELLVSSQLMADIPHGYVTGDLPFYEYEDGAFVVASLDWGRTGDPDAFRCRFPESHDRKQSKLTLNNEDDE